MNFEEARELMHKINHGDPESGVERAKTLNLRDGITTDSEGQIRSVREDTKLPLGALGPVGEYEVPDDLNDEPCVDIDALEFWRDAQRRDDEHA